MTAPKAYQFCMTSYSFHLRDWHYTPFLGPKPYQPTALSQGLLIRAVYKPELRIECCQFKSFTMSHKMQPCRSTHMFWTVRKGSTTYKKAQPDIIQYGYPPLFKSSCFQQLSLKVAPKYVLLSCSDFKDFSEVHVLFKGRRVTTN